MSTVMNLDDINRIFKANNWIATATRVTHIQGDASQRRYYRIWLEGSRPFATLVIMAIPTIGVHESEVDVISLGKILIEAGIRIPKIHLYDQERGWIFIDDCGDTSLYSAMETLSESDREHYYRLSIDEMLKFHGPVTSARSSHRAFSRSFSREKLLSELAFTRTNLFEKLWRRTLSVTQEAILTKGFQAIAERMQQGSFVLNHRDFHSRNIMIANRTVHILDYQDALMGLPQYDIASLLMDSYVNFNSSFIAGMLEYYREQGKGSNGALDSKEDFHKIFLWCSIQRNLKACGTFAAQRVLYGRTLYLKFIQPTLSKMFASLEHIHELRELSDMLRELAPQEEVP